MSGRRDAAARPPLPAGAAVALYVACAALCGAFSLLFLRDPLVAAVLSLAVAALPLRSVLAMLAARGERAARTRLRLLLQHLCAALTSGRSPETALAEAQPAMARLFGPSSPFCRALRTSVLALEAGRPFSDAVRGLSSALPCPEAEPILRALGSGRILGPRVLDLLRAALDMTTERALLEQDAASQSSARRVEALALSAMPFVAALALQAASPDFFEPAFGDARGRLALAAVYVVAVAAAALALRIVANPPRARGPARKTGSSPRSPSPAEAAPVPPPPAPRWMPPAYLRRLRLAFARNSDYPDAALARHIAGKPLRLAVGAAGFAAPVAFLGAGLFPALLAGAAGAVALSLLHDRDAQAERLRRDRDRILAYPLFLGLAAALLSAGVVPLRALEVAREGLAEDGGVVAEDLDRTLARIRAGCTPADALERLAFECGVPEIASALSMLAQVDRRGGAPTIALLRLQASACWALARAETRRRLDEAGTRLLLPTAIDLAAVIAVAGIPALLALQPLT